MQEVERGRDCRWPIAAVPCFVVLTVLLGLPFGFLSPASDSKDPLIGLITSAYMWTPGVAAIATCWMFRRDVTEMPFRAPASRYAWAGYGIPLAYASLAYGILWSTGLAASQFAVFDARKQEALGIGPGAGIVAAGIIATVGVIRACANAFGEEIGWRGFLVPVLAERMSFFGVASVSGIIWFAWHVPSILLTNYNAGAPMGFTLTCFGIGTIFMGGIAAWLSLRSQSLWPAVILHASHNAFVQTLFDPLTLQSPQAAYWATEFGIGITVTTVLAFVLLLWWGGVPQTRAAQKSGTRPSIALRRAQEAINAP